LRGLTARQYSIASSRSAVGDEVHLTVAAVDYEINGLRRFGAASRYLGTQFADTGKMRVYVDENPRFRLPQDTSRDIIMVGPGTGVAPFRAFVQERAAAGATGRQWLFFGARHFHSEFLYQSEWLEALKRRQLTHLDVAFSRDQGRKVYVQNRLRERGAEIFRWLESGAYFYVCGDANAMAPDVHDALLDIVGQHGVRDRDAAESYVAGLAADRRYLRDVY
jgi:sulfite reductase (NADPH) flavoprotein alpha-component